MSLLSSSSFARLGNVGFLSIGVIAFALVTLQGCAAPTVTASSSREPGIAIVGLGRLRADEPTRTTTIQRSERAVAARSSQSHERSFRSGGCRGRNCN